ncbi:MAG: DUF6476 family protein [Roseovarius sp.]
MTNSPENQPVDAGTVKYLRLLVTVLTVTMVLGFIIIVVLFVIRFSAASGPALPASISLPDGAEATAFTRGAGWYAVVTEDDRILIYDTETGALRQTIVLERD